MNRAEFERMSDKCLAAMVDVCPDVRCVVVPSYFSKQSFGDLDLLVSKERFDSESVARALRAVEVFRQKNAIYCCMGVRLDESGPVYQVDFVEEPNATYDFALNYYSFNDLGNLLGILVAKQGLKLKHNGLYYVLRDGDQVLGEVLVSAQFEDVLSFLGLDVTRFSRGFGTLHELFEFVASARFFHPDFYLLENRNHRSRTRDRKRPTYQAFLQYCAEMQTSKPTSRLNTLGLADLCVVFPMLQTQLQEVRERCVQAKASKTLFNGSLVSSLTGLKGKELGEFLLYLDSTKEKTGLASAMQRADSNAIAAAVSLALKFKVAERGYDAGFE